MSQIQVMLTSIEEVKNFVSLTNKYAFPIQMTTEKYKIDAKSIMGVFSLDLSKPINVVVESDAPEVQDFLAQVAQFEKLSHPAELFLLMFDKKGRPYSPNFSLKVLHSRNNSSFFAFNSSNFLESSSMAW